MCIDKILRILNALLQPGNQFLRGTIIIEIFDSIDEVGMLSEMKVFLSFALLTHAPASTVIDRTDKCQRLPVFAADQLFTSHL